MLSDRIHHGCSSLNTLPCEVYLGISTVRHCRKAVKRAVFEDILITINRNTTKEKIVQSKRVCAGSLTNIISEPQLAWTGILRAFFLFTDAVWYFSGVTFVLICYSSVFFLLLKHRLFDQSFFDMWEREAHISWSMVTCQGSTRLELP